MKTLTLAAAAVLFASPALAQTAAPAAPQLNVEIPELERVTADPTCGGKTALVEQRVFCVTTTQAGIGAVVDAYSAAFSTQGWLPAGGSENLIIYVKRKPEGGCDGFQMLAFADDTRVAAPAAPAWLAFAPIPGDVCAAQPAAPAAPAQ
jgi:hypothetical protein